MRQCVWFVVLAALPVWLASDASADTLIEEFNDVSRWNIFASGSGGASLSLAIPDPSGAMRISKSSDTAATSLFSLVAGMRSRFALDGDFSTFVDFNLPVFPLSDAHGWNEAVIMIGKPSGAAPFGGDWFEALRFSDSSDQLAQGFSPSSSSAIGAVTDSTMSGRLGISRTGDVLSAWIDHGTGPILLGSLTSSLLTGPVQVQIMGGQFHDSQLDRPHTALDVRFDNLIVIADFIVPEPPSGLFVVVLVCLIFRQM